MDSLTAFSLSGKTFVITGASSGIGRQCAIRSSELGATVILIGRNHDRLKETEAHLTDKHLHYTCVVDLLQYDDVERCVQTIRSERGRIDGIIHSAGISTTLPFRMGTPEKMNSFFETNVVAAMQLSRHTIKADTFRESGGSVVFVSSVMGAVGESGKTLYSMSKGALIAGARSLAIELAKRRIRVNCVLPGVVESPMSQSAVYSQDAESLGRITSLHPLGIGTVDDVAYACLFLLSDASKRITGTNLFVDGGYTAR